MAKPLRRDLETLFQKDNPGLENRLKDAEAIYMERLEKELQPGESVSALISFDDAYRTMTGKTQYRAALLVVTSQRVLHMAGKVQLVGPLLSPKDQAGSPDALEVASFPYDELAGVSGRRTMLSLGTQRELYLDLKKGSFVKIRGLTAKRSEFAEEKIREALTLH